jgi:putative Holliday junction resolvase
MSKKKPSTVSINDETLLGIDFGETNLGIAFGKVGLVVPLKVVSSKNYGEAIKEISRLAIENKISKIIMGLPLTADGKETQESLKVRHFTKMLKIFLKKPVDFQNEYNSSKNALGEAIEQGYSQKGRGKIDHLSAALILKSYYNENS